MMCLVKRNMSRVIQVPEGIIRLSELQLQFMVQNNDDVLLSFCKQKRPKLGFVTNFGIVWSDFESFKKDAEEICHGFWQLLVVYLDNRVIAPCHSDEIYNQRINPYTGEKLS